MTPVCWMHPQAGSSIGLSITVKGSSCIYTSSSSGRRRLLQSKGATSQVVQLIAGTATSGDPILTQEAAKLLAQVVNGIVTQQDAKEKLLGAAVTKEGYNAAAGAEQMTVETKEANVVSKLPLLPASSSVPR